jgi:hydroxymethylpyrimidine pyrophosphatase-like HAD family hydrolase
MVIYVDIDNTILDTDGLNYENTKPMKDRIKKINDLYDEGHTIVYWTARGTLSGIDYYDLTKSQLDKFGVKYHELKLKKPAYDLFIDDRNVNSEEYFK